MSGYFSSYVIDIINQKTDFLYNSNFREDGIDNIPVPTCFTSKSLKNKSVNRLRINFYKFLQAKEPIRLHSKRASSTDVLFIICFFITVFGGGKAIFWILITNILLKVD